MLPSHAIAYATGGAILVAILASLVATDGKAVAPSSLRGIVEEAAYLCNLPKQDRSPTAALLHSATGEGMLQAARSLAPDEAIVRQCGVDPQRLQQACSRYKAEALRALQGRKVQG